MTESIVLVPFGEQFLGLTCEEFKAALERGRELIEGATAEKHPASANGDRCGSGAPCVHARGLGL